MIGATSTQDALNKPGKAIPKRIGRRIAGKITGRLMGSLIKPTR
jgi:hypothetical protein